jgi:hypothetical protein
VGDIVGVLIAIVSSDLGGTAAAVTRYVIGNTDPITLSILRWGIGFLVLLPITLNLVAGLIAVFAGIIIATTGAAKA